MIRYENECVGCPPELGCLGSCCPNRNVPHFYCDNCGDDVEELFECCGMQMCRDCVEKMLKDKEVDIYSEDFDILDYADKVEE